ncbi:sugar phosphate isomerase/epimerase family protein [Salsipaludibacter albus]|uniref:sugar phosphate isomerase/epimerase family protein n=1 Tax=Salsipaludibacter albus TaxID=2849650 RepID=UPI001EE43A32|nr:sugar phosphate isomerase/epimerase [Salsipaludibacter albus]MBY5162001.1 sugar phosphate isomerase/epimerase [Salsipaludibacter albus]
MEHSATNMNRRRFLRNATIAALGLTAAGNATLASAAPGSGRGPTGRRPVPRGNISIQLYSLRGIIPNGNAAGVAAVMETLFDIGYRKVEPYSNHGLGWEGFRSVLDDAGLTATSLHNGGRNPQAVVEAALAMGSTYTNFPFASYGTLDEWRALAVDVLNPVAAAMTDAGVKYGYHNHATEFQVEEDGVQAYDVLLEEFTGHMQADLYWVVTGGADPVEVFSRDPGRFLQFHVKDRDESGFFADPGEGTIDFPRIFAARQESGVIEYIAENDQPADQIEFAETAFEYLRNVRF